MPSLDNIGHHPDVNRPKATQRHGTGDDIVNHNAEATGQAFVQPADGPGLPHVKQPEQHERHEYPVKLIRKQAQGNPHPHKLIPDNTAVIMHFQICRGFAAQPDTHQKRRQTGTDHAAQPPLGRDEQGAGWGVVGQYAAKKLAPEAAGYYRRQMDLGGNQWLSDETQEWRVRAALRAGATP